MGILGTGNKTTGRSSTTTVVSAGTGLNGELTVDGNLHVDGHVEGVVHASQDVSIGLSGVVEGTLTARRVLVAGALKGKVDCEAIHVVGRGCLLGEVLVDDLTVDPGATFVGESRLREALVASPAATETAAPPASATLSLATAQGPKLAHGRPSPLGANSDTADADGAEADREPGKLRARPD